MFFANFKMKILISKIFVGNTPLELPFKETFNDIFITKTRLFKYIEILSPKTENFQIKNSDIFHISAQNIDYGYLLEPPRRGGSNEYPQSMV